MTGAVDMEAYEQMLTEAFCDGEISDLDGFENSDLYARITDDITNIAKENSLKEYKVEVCGVHDECDGGAISVDIAIAYIEDGALGLEIINIMSDY